MVNELRKDYLLDRWVVIAGNRGKRPSDFESRIEDKDDSDCFFCPGNEDQTPPEICRKPESSGDWKIRCFPNKYPAMADEEGGSSTGLLTSRPADGFHEVMVETPVHGESLTDLSVDELVEVLETYSERILDLQSRQNVEYVCLFKNHGKSSGASLTHSHTQIITLPFTPPLVEKEAQACREYREKYGSCIFCDVIEKESSSERMIIDEEEILAFTPYASRFPFEAWITPRKHVNKLEDLTEKQYRSMASTLLEILGKLKKGLKDPSYNLMLHYSPLKEDLHLHWELAPRLSTLAGFELGTEVVINTMSPEDAASYYRDI